MAHTVKQVAAMSGVSVRTLHFYHEMGLLKPAYVGANGYRFYEQAQLLLLQQILFYRELGFGLKQIKRILTRDGFELVADLQAHRRAKQDDLARTQALLETIDKTVDHLKGTITMASEEMFAGFHIAAGTDRFDEHLNLGGEPIDCKLSGRDTDGTLCVFEFSGSSGGPRHSHNDQDEWIYVVGGELDFQVGENRLHAGPGACVFLPRKVPHSWGCADGSQSKIINVYQPAGKMEEFFREVARYDGKPPIHEALTLPQMHQFFLDHGMDLCGPPMFGNFEVDHQGRISQLSDSK